MSGDIAAGHERSDLLRHGPEDRDRSDHLAETPEFGQGEVADRPMAAPNVQTNEIATASTAPARTAPHSTKLDLAAEAALELAGAGPTCVMAFLSNNVVSEAQEG
jgi:hypothetical protein